MHIYITLRVRLRVVYCLRAEARLFRLIGDLLADDFDSRRAAVVLELSQWLIL